MDKKRLLIVDDEPELLLLMEARLAANGYEVFRATDGQLGLEIAKKEKPDLIILDLMLPKMDGFKVCGLLKKDSRYAHIPILLFTARAQEEDRQLGAEMGADGYLTKPFNPEILLAKISTLLLKAGSQLEDEGKKNGTQNLSR